MFPSENARSRRQFAWTKVNGLVAIEGDACAEQITRRHKFASFQPLNQIRPDHCDYRIILDQSRFVGDFGIVALLLQGRKPHPNLPATVTLITERARDQRSRIHRAIKHALREAALEHSCRQLGARMRNEQAGARQQEIVNPAGLILDVAIHAPADLD